MTYYPPRYLFRQFEILKRIRHGNNFLEIGAGNLMLTKEVLHHFRKGTIIDYNPQVLREYDKLSPYLKERLDIIISDVISCELDNTFDCILACEVLEHIKDDNYFIQKIYDLLNYEGQIILSVPSRMKYWSVHDEIVGHLRRYEKDEIMSLLISNNFSKIKILSYGFPFINVLRQMRIFLANYKYKEKKEWSQSKQSQESAFVKKNVLSDIAGLIVNKYTTYPLSFFSGLFNNFDFSDGYIAIARKQ